MTSNKRNKRQIIQQSRMITAVRNSWYIYGNRIANDHRIAWHCPKKIKTDKKAGINKNACKTSSLIVCTVAECIKCAHKRCDNQKVGIVKTNKYINKYQNIKMLIVVEMNEWNWRRKKAEKHTHTYRHTSESSFDAIRCRCPLRWSGQGAQICSIPFAQLQRCKQFNCSHFGTRRIQWKIRPSSQQCQPETNRPRVEARTSRWNE